MENTSFSAPRDGEGTPAEFNSAGDNKTTPSETVMSPVPGTAGLMGFLRCPVCFLTESDDIVEGHCGNSSTVYVLVDTHGNIYTKEDAPYCDHCIGKLRATYASSIPTVDELDDEYQTALEDSWHEREMFDARCELSDARLKRSNLLEWAETPEEAAKVIAETMDDITDAIATCLYLGVKVELLPNEEGAAE